MSDSLNPFGKSWSPSFARQLEEICESFERSWQTPRADQPRLEEFLASVTEPERPSLLRELLHVELFYRLRQHDTFVVDEYHRRFPEHKDIIVEVFSAVVSGADAVETSGHASTPAATPSPATMSTPAATPTPQLSEGAGLPVTSPWTQPAVEGAPDMPGYTIVGKLGQGGMGVVYKAQQAKLKRLVALKMILSGAGASEADLARFRIEAEAIARLKHPGIVQIYEVGEHEDRPYFSLEYVDGGSLAKRLARTPQPPRWCAEMMEKLARAMHAAHQSGVIHRDLKPANVLLSRDGEPKVTDFGLAKQLDSGDGQTRTGDVMGTPSYMAPEQAAGDLRAIGPLTDVFSLGAMFYEMLTGRVPFLGANVIETMLLVTTEDPVAPRKLLPKVPRDLETICLKCLQKVPAKRYESAAALGDDLRRWMNDEPIQARPVSQREKVFKWARRNKPKAWAAGLLALLIVGSVIGGFVILAEQAYSTKLELDKERELQRATAEVQAGKKEAMDSIQRKDWKDWAGAKSGWTKVMTAAGNEPLLAEYRQEAEARLQEAQKNIDDSERHYEKYVPAKDSCLFLFSRFTGLDLPENEKKARAAALAAASVYDLTTSPDLDRVIHNPFLPEREHNQLIEDAFTILVLLAGTTSEPREALALLDQARKLRPASLAAHQARARYLKLLGDNAAAEREREAGDRLVQELRAGKATGNGLDYFLLGMEEYHKRELDGAMAHFDAVIREQPDHYWAQFYLGVCYLRTQRPGEAKASFTACMMKRSDFVWTYLLRGYAYGELGGILLERKEQKQAEASFQAAEADFRKAETMKNPGEDARYVLLVNRGVARFFQKRYLAAEADLRAATVLKPERFQAFDNLAHVLYEQHKLDEAVTALTQAIALEPTVLPALLRARGRIHVKRKDLAAALADYHQAIRDKNNDPKMRAEDLAEYGRLLLQLKRADEALHALEKAIELRPTYAESYRLQGAALVQLNQHKSAVKAYDTYLSMHGRSTPEIFALRGLLQQKLGNYAGAIDDFTHSLALKAEPRTLATRGWAYLVNKVPRLALHDFQEVLNRDPDNTDALTGRGFARAKLGSHGLAATDASEAVRRAPSDPRTIYNAARVYAQSLSALNADKGPRTLAMTETRLTYQDQGTSLLRKSVDLLPTRERTAFWQEQVKKDPALAPLRRTKEYKDLASVYEVQDKP